MSMRIRTDGKHAHQTETIEQAAELWDCNKTTALLRSAEFACRMDEDIQLVSIFIPSFQKEYRYKELL